MNKIKIATHNKMFHADEVTAIALIEIFLNKDIQVDRVDHETKEFSSYDLVIDIGKKFNGIKYFDHHQYKGGKSSAGLIWDYIGLQNKYPKISKLIDLVDRNDVGVEKAKEFEYSSLIKCFNGSNILDNDKNFFNAVEFAETILLSMKENEESAIQAEEIVKNSYYFNGNSGIIELSEFTPHWGIYINGEKTPEIKAVVWEDIEEQRWKVKITPKRLGSFDLNYKRLKQDSSMEFVHSSGHFAVAKDEETIQKYLEKEIK